MSSKQNIMNWHSNIFDMNRMIGIDWSLNEHRFNQMWTIEFGSLHISPENGLKDKFRSKQNSRDIRGI